MSNLKQKENFLEYHFAQYIALTVTCYYMCIAILTQFVEEWWFDQSDQNQY